MTIVGFGLLALATLASGIVPAHGTPARDACEPSYPTVCIARGLQDLDCADVPWERFEVTGLDPHRFDSDGDGLGCE